MSPRIFPYIRLDVCVDGTDGLYLSINFAYAFISRICMAFQVRLGRDTALVSYCATPSHQTIFSLLMWDSA